MFCSRCGQQNNVSATYCAQCDQSLATNVPVAEPAKAHPANQQTAWRDDVSIHYSTVVI